MISYFYHKKGNLRPGDTETVTNEKRPASEESPNCEDSLTATVFDGLKYLPAEMFWQILKASLYKDKLPEECGEIEMVSFWDKWSAKGENDVSNINFVEPDVFIRFKEIDVIIEAKRYNEKQQTEQQMMNEINAYHNNFSKEDKALYFVQCGGLHNKNDERNYLCQDSEIPICKTDWTRILDTIIAEKKSLEYLNSPETNAHIRILDDIIKGMELHHYYKLRWLSELNSQNINNYSLENLFEYAK